MTWLNCGLNLDFFFDAIYVTKQKLVGSLPDMFGCITYERVKLLVSIYGELKIPQKQQHR
jgi:hypothetical protein